MNRAHNTMDEAEAEAELGLYPHFSNLSNTGGEHAVAMHTIHPHLQQCPSNILQCMDQSGNIDAIRYIEYSKRRRVDFWNRANFICNMKSTLRQQRCQQLCQQLQLQRSACLSRSNSNAMHPTGRFSLVTPSSLTRTPAKMPTAAAAAAAAANTNTNTNTSTNTGNFFSTASTPSSFSSGDDEKRTLIADMYRNGVEGLSARRNSNSSINSNPQSKIAPNIAARFMTPRSSSMPFVSSIAMKNTNLSPVGRNSSVIDEKIAVVRTGTGTSTSSMHGDIKRGTNGHTKSNKNLATLSAEPQVQSLPLPTPTPVPTPVPTSPSQVQEEEKQQQQQHLPSQPHRHLEKDEIEAAEALLFGMGRNRSMSEVAVRSAPTHVSPSVTMESENRDDGHPSEHKGESRVGKKVRGQRQRQRRADRPKSRATKKRKGRDWSVTGMMMTPAMYDVCDGGESSTVVSAEGANNVVNKRRTHPKRKYTTIIIE